MSEDTSMKTSNSTTRAEVGAAMPHSVDLIIAGFNQWQRALAVLGTVLAAAANIKLFIEQQWAFASITLLLCIVGVALYIVSHRQLTVGTQRAKLLRAGAAGFLGSVPIVTVLAFVFLGFAPRATEDGPIIAVARFEGPTLPPPYQNCRPSDMLADAMNDVAQRYSHLTVFELPYVVDPNGRWAKKWAAWHGILEGADTVVYGEYSLVDNMRSELKPDRLRISPEVDQVPMLPLGPKTAPLQQWEFPDRVVSINELCTGRALRFLRDGARLSLAIVGLQTFDAQQYGSAERALAEAEQPANNNVEALFATKPQRDDSQCDVLEPSASKCSGVLAFYLAALEQRTGHYAKAEREYAFAAEKLNRPSPFIDLAELYALQNRGDKVLEALMSAESVDPNSIVATATRAQYEYEYGNTDEAKLELERAVALKSSHSPSEYEQIVVCRTIHLIDEQRGLDCRARVPHNGYAKSGDAEVEYGRWLVATHRRKLVEAGITQLRQAVQAHPSHIKANYMLARALADTRSPNDPEVREHDLVAVNARAFTDEELTDQGNAAVELNELARARQLYDKALRVNPRFAYAYSNRGALYQRLGEYESALHDLRIAAALHPRERALPAAIAALSDTIKHI